MPPNTGGFDVMFQAREEVVNAVLVSLLDHLPDHSGPGSAIAKEITAPRLSDGTMVAHASSGMSLRPNLSLPSLCAHPELG